MLKKIPVISTNNSLEYNFLTFFVLKAVNGYFILSASVVVGQAIFILIYQIGQGSPLDFIIIIIIIIIIFKIYLMGVVKFCD